MKKIMALVLTVVTMAGFLPDVTASDTSYRILYSNSFSVESDDDISYTYMTPEYKTSADDPITKGKIMSLKSSDEGEYKKSSTMKITPQTCGIDKANMYGIFQFDVSMTSMVDVSKNIYVYFCDTDGKRITSSVSITPRGSVDLSGGSSETDKYDTRALKTWNQNGFNRIRLVFKLSDENGNKNNILICGLYVNNKEITLNAEVNIGSGIDDFGSIIMHLSQRKSADTNSFYADFDNIFYAVTYSAPVFSDSNSLKNTILKYYNYIKDDENESEDDISTFVSNIKGEPASAVNNPLLSQTDVDSALQSVKDLYSEIFCDENYNDIKAELNTACQKADNVLECINNGTINYYTSDETALLKTACDNGKSVYDNDISTKKQVVSATDEIYDIIGNESYTYSKVNVTNADGTKTSSFAPGGKLNSITINKHTTDSFSGTVNFGIFDKSTGLLKNFGSKQISFESDETGDIPVDLSDIDFRLSDDVRDLGLSIFLWNDNLAPVVNRYDWVDMSDWSVYFMSSADGYSRINIDAMPIYGSDGEIYVCAKYILNIMNVSLLKYGDKYYAEDDFGNYIEFCAGNSTAHTSRGDITLKKDVFYFDKNFVMLPMSLINSVFGSTLEEVDDINRVIKIKYIINYATFPTMASGGYPTSYTPSSYSAGYVISNLPADADIDVYYSATYKLGDSSLEYDGITDNMYTRYWQKAPAPVREGTYAVGGLSYLRASRTYDMKYVITYGGETKTYSDVAAFVTNSETNTGKSDCIYSAKGLLLVPTYENMSYYIDYDSYSGVSSCEVSYKKTSEDSWHKAYTPFTDTAEKQFRGSIVNLNDNTEYTVKAVIKDLSGNVLAEKTASAKTKNNNPNTQTVLPSSFLDAYRIDYEDKTINEPISICGLKGTEDTWKLIDCTGYTLDAGFNSTSALTLDNCEYVILYGLKVTGGYRCGISVNSSCKNIRITNCDISGFGRTGILNKDGRYSRDGSRINYDPGILLLDAENVTVERCYIHDSLCRTNAWTGSTWSSTHPAGSTAIYYRVKSGCVIRYNDLVGSEIHRWNDGIEGYGNGSYSGGPGKDTDIYGNMFAFGQDDGVELDGGQMNVRVYNNRFEQFLCGISNVPDLIGPTYMFGNLIVDMGTDSEKSGSGFKTGGSFNGSTSYLFNNTYFAKGPVASNTSFTFGGETSDKFNFVTRNNIFVHSQSGNGYKNNSSSSVNDNDYDFVYGKNNNYNSSSVSTGHSFLYTSDNSFQGTYKGLGSVIKEISFKNTDTGLYNVGSDSSCYESGTYIDNFMETENPNIGALQSENEFRPYRPVDMYASAYSVKLNDKSNTTILFTLGDVGDVTYELCKSNDMDWVTAKVIREYTSGGKKTVMVRITVNTDNFSDENKEFNNNRYYDNGTLARGIVTFRLSNGYSVPVSVACVKN